MTAAIRKLHKEAEKLCIELTYPDRLTDEREAAIYARLQEIDAAIYG